MSERAAMRDASWFARPGRAARYHIVKGVGSACGMLLLADDHSVDAATVAEHLRCRRPGCARGWPGGSGPVVKNPKEDENRKINEGE